MGQTFIPEDEDAIDHTINENYTNWIVYLPELADADDPVNTAVNWIKSHRHSVQSSSFRSEFTTDEKTGVTTLKIFEIIRFMGSSHSVYPIVGPDYLTRIRAFVFCSKKGEQKNPDDSNCVYLPELADADDPALHAIKWKIASYTDQTAMKFTYTIYHLKSGIGVLKLHFAPLNSKKETTQEFIFKTVGE